MSLTVVIPVFDRDETLRRAVASVLLQPGRVAAIVVDDGSTPAFAAVCDELAGTGGDRVRVVHQVNQGPAAARNTGLRNASSSMVMFLDSDDELTATAFAAIDRHLLQPEGVGMVCGAVRVVSAGAEERVDRPVVLPGVPWTRLSWVCGSFAVRADVALAVEGYDEALTFGENTDFILRLAEECRARSLQVTVIDDVLSVYHCRPEAGRYDAKRLEAAIHLLGRGRVDLKLPSERARLHAIAAVNAARVGRYRLSVRHAALAVLTEPRNHRHFGRLALALTGPVARRRWRQG